MEFAKCLNAPSQAGQGKDPSVHDGLPEWPLGKDRVADRRHGAEVTRDLERIEVKFLGFFAGPV